MDAGSGARGRSVGGLVLAAATLASVERGCLTLEPTRHWPDGPVCLYPVMEIAPDPPTTFAESLMSHRLSGPSRALVLLLLSALAVLIPAAARAQMELPLVNLGWLIVPVYLNDEPVALRFVLDTGASWTAVSAGTAARFSKEGGREIEVQGASGPTTARLATVPSIRVGEFTLTDRDVIVLPDQDLVSDDEEFDGILGADILSRFDMLVDAPGGSLWLYPQGATPPPAAAAALGTALAVELLGGRLIRHGAEVNGSPVRALLDSGARRMLINRVGGIRAGIEIREDSAQTVSPGLGGADLELHSGSLGRLEVADTIFSGLRTLVGDLPVFRAMGMQDEPTLIIGAPLLARCPVFVAYSASTIRYCRQPATQTASAR